MFGLVDCNNFYASCERVFNPYWVGKPVIVLSNNDGCAIAMSNEAKKLGIKMGTPAYQLKEIVEKYNVGVFSSNYTLYGDMSNRVMTMLGSYVEEMEVYSIDEAFLNFRGFENYNLQEYGREIVRAVTKGTGIPVSLGVGPSKTLAKLASKFAKKYSGYRGSCIIDSEDKRVKALKLFEIEDVWGILGRFYFLRGGEGAGINAGIFDVILVKAYLNVVGRGTYMGISTMPILGYCDYNGAKYLGIQFPALAHFGMYFSGIYTGNCVFKSVRLTDTLWERTV